MLISFANMMINRNFRTVRLTDCFSLCYNDITVMVNRIYVLYLYM